MDNSATYRCSGEACPMAQVELPDQAAFAMALKCSMCGAALVASHEAQSAGSSELILPGGLNPVTMPTFLAHPTSALLAESHPRMKLHWLVDTAELAVRWAVAVALAEVVNANDGVIPEAVTRRIRDHVERPTLGRWLGIYRELCRAKPTASLLAPGVFDLYAAEFAPRFRQEKDDATGGTLETSLLVLRNQLSHGGGMSKLRAQALLDQHLPGLEELLGAVVSITEEVELVALDGGQARLLVGTEPINISVPILTNCQDGPWLVGPDGALPLLPLADYGPVRQVDVHGVAGMQTGGPAVQVYSRGSKDRLSYTPLGRDEVSSEVVDKDDVEKFRALFRLDAERPRKTVTTAEGFAWDDFLRESRVLAEDLVGRADELKVAKSWLKSRDSRDEAMSRLGWISGGPGVGKSMIMSRLASDYSNASPLQRGLFYHRFRGGDARNSRRSFLRLLQAALWAWEPLAKVTEAPSDESIEGRALEDDVRARLEVVATLESAHPRAPAPAFWVLLDGLDEVTGNDPDLALLLRQVSLPGTVWLVAGRPEHRLDVAFSASGCEALFADGLPVMKAEDIRAMLLEGLGNARYALLRRDEDQGEDLRNAFVERVVERAHGLPLYVHLLLEDLRSGQLNVQDEDQLPDGLTAYYDALMDRVGISDVRAVLPLIVCLLARAEEPLDATSLAYLCAGAPDDVDLFHNQVEAALRVGQALLRLTPTRDGADATHRSSPPPTWSAPTAGARPSSRWSPSPLQPRRRSGWGATTPWAGKSICRAVSVAPIPATWLRICPDATSWPTPTATSKASIASSTLPPMWRPWRMPPSTGPGTCSCRESPMEGGARAPMPISPPTDATRSSCR